MAEGSFGVTIQESLQTIRSLVGSAWGQVSRPYQQGSLGSAQGNTRKGDWTYTTDQTNYKYTINTIKQPGKVQQIRPGSVSVLWTNPTLQHLNLQPHPLTCDDCNGLGFGSVHKNPPAQQDYKWDQYQISMSPGSYTINTTNTTAGPCETCNGKGVPAIPAGEVLGYLEDAL